MKKHEMDLYYKPSNELKINGAINPCFFSFSMVITEAKTRE